MEKREKEHDKQDRNIKVETKKLRVGSGTKQTEKGKPGKEKGRREENQRETMSETENKGKKSE